MTANALVVAHIDLVVGVALLALWLRTLPALELLGVRTGASKAGRGNVVGADILAASRASGRWWRERGDDLNSAWSLQALLDNLWLWCWSGGVDLLNVGIGLLVGVVLRLLLLLVLGGDLSCRWEQDTWLQIARSGDWTTESLWNIRVELTGEIIVHGGASILICVLHLAVLLENFLSPAVNRLAFV